ncbi:MAG: ABC transporter permease [Bacteroidota bacterium]
MGIFLKMFRKDRTGAIGGMVVLAFLVLAILAPIVAPMDPLRIQPRRVTSQGTQYPPYPPSRENWFGTDQLGRDIFSRVLYGLRLSILIGLVVRGASMVVGVGVGLLAGYFGGSVDRFLNFLCDVMLAFPSLLIAMAVSLVLGPSIRSLCIALTIIGWPDVAKLVRAQAISLREREFVQAARALGASDARILLRHILPNCLGVILVSFSMGIPGAIMYEAGLSFFGLGVKPPNPSLGSIISDGRGYLAVAPWYICFPGLMLAVLVLSFNVFGDAIRDMLDPVRRGKS